MPMPLLRRPLSALALVLVVLLAGAGAAGTAEARSLSELRAKLKAESRNLSNASGAWVVDLTSGRRLFSRNSDRALTPASNAKLFTTAAALRRFGASGTLGTRSQIGDDVEVDGDGRLAGDLYLVGGGDPSLNDVALRALAKQIVAETGLKSVIGGVVGDESFFDARRGGQSSGFGPDSNLGGQLGGLTWGHGRAGPDGPATVAAARLEFFLKKLGVTVRKAPRGGRVAAAPGGPGRVVGTVRSPPMTTLAAITNQPSDNFYAETLVKALGATFGDGGSTQAGLRVVSEELDELGLRPTLADGSGLSRADQASARQIATLLAGMYQSNVSRAFVGSLAVPGRIGTLAGRMRGTAAEGRCQAKTGTLRNVSALSGYCRTTGGRIVAFSFIENEMDALSAKAVEDRMVPAIVSYRP